MDLRRLSFFLCFVSLGCAGTNMAPARILPATFATGPVAECSGKKQKPLAVVRRAVADYAPYGGMTLTPVFDVDRVAVARALRDTGLFKDVLLSDPAVSEADVVYVDLEVFLSDKSDADARPSGSGGSGVHIVGGGKGALVVLAAVAAVAVAGVAAYAVLPVSIPNWGSVYADAWLHIRDRRGTLWEWHADDFVDWNVVIYPIYRTGAVLDEVHMSVMNKIYERLATHLSAEQAVFEAKLSCDE